jgi:transcription antitermination protein NusB
MAIAKTHMDGMTISNLNNPAQSNKNENSADSLIVGTRRKARELALRGLYALELSGNTFKTVVRQVVETDENDQVIKKFASEMMEKAFQEKEQLDQYVKNVAANWAFSRIAIMDKLVMRMAICEFLYFFDIPPKVSIDEAIELTKLYSTEKSSKFVNGILDAVLLQLRESNQLVKTGRGLQDTTIRKKPLKKE